MRIVALKTLREFWTQHPDAEHPLRAWHDEVSRAQFGNASILKGRRVVFNIKGNNYRLVAALAYHTGLVFVKFVGTHAEYDCIDAETVERR
jgi:mRNA interferase HigB